MKENKPLSKSEVIQLVSILTDQEKHFNGLETNYRLLSSTWLLGSLGTIGYILLNVDQLTIDFWLLIGLVGAAAGTGIVLLWILDVRVFHRLLNSVFIQGILLEVEHDWLPKVRTEMMLSQKGDVAASANLYYTLSSALLFGVSSIGLISFSDHLIWVAVPGIVVVIIVMIIIWRSTRSKEYTEIMKFLNDHIDEISVLGNPKKTNSHLKKILATNQCDKD